jgi:toxin ParE1/3/4
MTRRIIRSDRALADLEEHAEYIRQRSPRAALRFLDAVESLFHQLASMPGIGQLYQTTHPLNHDLRCFPVPKFPSHIVYYQPLGDGIIVIRVLHGARDIDRIIAQDESPEDDAG